MASVVYTVHADDVGGSDNGVFVTLIVKLIYMTTQHNSLDEFYTYSYIIYNSLVRLTMFITTCKL